MTVMLSVLLLLVAVNSVALGFVLKRLYRRESTTVTQTIGTDVQSKVIYMDAKHEKAIELDEES